MSYITETNTALAEPLDRVSLATATKLAHDIRLLSATWCARLNVRLDDPYYFDHPLDHVPGMALIGGLLDLIRVAGINSPEEPGRNLALTLEFPSFCELARPVELRAVEASAVTEPDGQPSLSVRARQGERVVCAGSATFRPAIPCSEPARSTEAWLAAGPLPADRALVHRVREENVLISGITAEGDSRVVSFLPVASGHQLATGPGGPHRAEAIVDAARQFGVLVNHVEHGRPRDTRLIMLGLDVDIPCGLTADVYLRWWATPAGRGQSRFDVEVIAGTPANEPCGVIHFDYHCASPAAYRRLRDLG